MSTNTRLSQLDVGTVREIRQEREWEVKVKERDEVILIGSELNIESINFDVMFFSMEAHDYSYASAQTVRDTQGIQNYIFFSIFQIL